MSWGTIYKYEGYLLRITQGEINDKIDECNETVERVFREILAYMAMTPPINAKDEEDYEYPWAEHLVVLIKRYHDELEEAIALRTHLYDCKETLDEHPENVQSD